MLVLIGCQSIPQHPPPLQPSDEWEVVRESDIAKVSSEWKTPVWLKVNTAYWEDGAYISSDGNTLYFAYYPGDLINDVQTRKFKDDIDVYISKKPFISKKKHKISEDIWSEGGVMISNGDIYYMSNKDGSDDIYKNGVKLSFNTDENENDPHLCKAMDELYFWKNNDIYVFRNGNVEKLHFPINTDSADIQPFLTKDCQTMYFSSNRDGVSKIYKSTRSGDNWLEPTVVVESKNGVGEPTLTADGKFLYFVQIFTSDECNVDPLSDECKHNADIMFVERK
jgi:hypothetical protein